MSGVDTSNRADWSGRSATSRRGFLTVAGAAVVGSTAGCIGSGEAGSETVTFGTLTIPAVAEVLIARERGFFEERDVEIEVERIQSAPQATPRLANGDLDVATGSIGASLFNAAARGVDISVVADQTQYWRGQPSANKILVRDAVYSEGMSIADVSEDFTIALHGQGNVDSYIWGRLLQHNDMTWADVSTTEIMYTNMSGAMAAGEIDACAIPDPLGLQLIRQTGARQLLNASAIAPRMQIGVYLFGGPFANDRPDVARRWLEGYLLGVREYYEMGGFPDEEVASIVSDEFGLPESAIRASVPSLPHKNGRLNTKSIANQQTYHACRNVVEQPVETSEIVEETFLDDALDAVGRLDDPTPSVETIREWGEQAPSSYAPIDTISTPEDFPEDALCE